MEAKTIFSSTSDLKGLLLYLCQEGCIDEASAKTASAAAIQLGLPLVHYLVREQLVSSQAILASCAKHFDLPIFDLAQYDLRLLQEGMIPPEFICRYRIIPLYRSKTCLNIGMSDPSDYATLMTISFHTGLHIRPMLVAEALLDKILKTYCQHTKLESQLESALSQISENKQQQIIDEKKQDEDPIVTLVNQLLREAQENQVSDIHLEPYKHYCRIRFRQDGLLHEITQMPLELALRVTTRLKIMANLNIAERRLPQDGRLILHQPSILDMRINTCPTLFGEKMVLRLLDTAKNSLALHSLGMTTAQLNIFLASLAQPQGLVIVTGPTGSGKTLTLYSALQQLNQTEKNIFTVEDPVEIELHGINQVSVNPYLGLDFPSILRTLLRQDPDVIMIGEIRDSKTAEIALQAAQTGHLVLTTLHTNSAIEALLRLQSLGMSCQQFIPSLSMIVAQRLVRTLCIPCKQKRNVSNQVIAHLDETTKGCGACHKGYRGRIGIFEVLPMTESIKELLFSGINLFALQAQLKQKQWMSMQEAGLEKITAGITCHAELKRVLGTVRE